MSVPADDRGLTLGDGLFETVLAEDGALVDLPAHLDRLERSCAVLGLSAPARAAVEAAAHAALAGRSERSAVRLTWTAGSGGRGLDRPAEPQPRLLATCAPAPLWSEPARVMISSVRRNAGSPASRCKTLSYIDNVLARAEARSAGAEEAIMLDTQGRLSCASAANLFWFVGERLFTPALTCAVLPGTVRARTLQAARTVGLLLDEVEVGPGALEAAEGVFLTSSLIGFRPVTGRDHAMRETLGTAVAALRTRT